ncbi:hypothetical protein NPIL_418211, partial [Nephila pilipes]
MSEKFWARSNEAKTGSNWHHLPHTSPCQRGEGRISTGLKKNIYISGTFESLGSDSPSSNLLSRQKKTS